MIGLQNFGGFTNRFDDPVNASLKQWITNKEFDIFGITETNAFWPKIIEKLQFHNRIKEWWNPNLTKGNFAHNPWDTSNDVKQWGGVAQISQNQASLRWQGCKKDPTGQGRWVSQKYWGTKGKMLQVIMAYRPCQ